MTINMTCWGQYHKDIVMGRACISYDPVICGDMMVWYSDVCNRSGDRYSTVLGTVLCVVLRYSPGGPARTIPELINPTIINHPSGRTLPGFGPDHHPATQTSASPNHLIHPHPHPTGDAPNHPIILISSRVLM